MALREQGLSAEIERLSTALNANRSGNNANASIAVDIFSGREESEQESISKSEVAETKQNADDEARSGFSFED